MTVSPEPSGPVLPSEVQCWTYSGEALVGYRNHNLYQYGNRVIGSGGPVQFRCFRCGLTGTLNQLTKAKR